MESVYAQRLQALTPIKLPLKKKPAAPQPIADKKKSTPKPAVNAPPPPPPPNDLMNSKGAPPPPPPPSLFNDSNSVSKKSTPNKVVQKIPMDKKNEIFAPKNKLETARKQPINLVENNEAPKKTAVSDLVDETPIKVSAQKKLWETANQNQQQQDKIKTNKKTKSISNNTSANASVQPPQQQPTTIPKPEPIKPQPVTPAQTTAQNATVKQSNKPSRQNKLGTWEKCSNEPVATKQQPVSSTVSTASPEPKKKIIIKKKDANNNDIPQRRTTKDLVAAIEASSECNSQSSTPFSSPGTQRRQMQYGKRTSTQPITNTETPAAPRKPIWGLREQVNDLKESTPTSTPTRSRSPAVTSNIRDSHSPSPGPGGSKKVFGRVPPRKTSLSGAGNIGANENGANDVSFYLFRYSTNYSGLFFRFFSNLIAMIMHTHTHSHSH